MTVLVLEIVRRGGFLAAVLWFTAATNQSFSANAAISSVAGELDQAAALSPPLTDAESAESNSYHPPAQEQQALGQPRIPQRAADADDETKSAARTAALQEISGGDLMRVVGALVAVIALIALTRYVLLRMGGGLSGGGRPSGVLEILARYPIGRGQQLLLLKVGRRVVLVHATSGSGGTMRTLAEITDGSEVAALLGRIEAGTTGRDAQRFRSILDRFRNEHDGAYDPEASTGGSDENEIIDLTRQGGSSGNFAAWLGMSRGRRASR